MKAGQISTSKGFIYGVLLIGLGLSLWTGLLIYERQQLQASIAIQSHLKKLIRVVDEELIASTEVLYSLSGLVKTFPNLTLKQFESFTSELNTRKPGILLLEWQPRVKAHEREQFVRMARKSYKDFEMLEPGPNSELVKAGIRDEYFPVLYSASSRPNSTSIGLDVSWSKLRMTSKYQARDSAKPRASSSFYVYGTLRQQGLLKGFAISVPVYSTEHTPMTVAERREKLMGIMAAVVYLDDLFLQQWQSLSSSLVNVRITDVTSKQNPKLLIDKVAATPSNLTKGQIFNIYGRDWRFEINASDAFMAAYLRSYYFIFPVIFLVLTLILFFILNLNRRNTLKLESVGADLQRALSASKAADKTKAYFIANMSHEIRTPMTAIIGYGDLIKRESDRNVRDSYVDAIKKSGKHLLEIIDDILELSKLEDGKVKMKPRRFSLKAMLSQVEEIVTSQYQTADISFSKSIDGDVPDSLVGDDFRIKQILINLLCNAFKFTKEGHIELKVLKRELSPDQFQLQFIVADTGIGMGQEYVDHAFEPFSQEDPSTSRKYGGVGLGLSIVNRFVNLMGGSIELETTLGKGSAFKVCLPFKTSEASLEYLPNSPVISGRGGSVDLSDKHILLAEDDDDAIFLFRQYFAETGAQIDFVRNGQQLVDLSTKNDYDLVLTDIQMPVMDGLEATKLLRRRGYRLPIIAISAHSIGEEADAILRAGVNQYLVKPFNRDDLLNLVDRTLH